MSQYLNPPPIVSGWTPLVPSAVAGPSSAVPPMSSAGTSASAATNSTQQQRRRRPAAAYRILSDFYHNVTDHPTREQRHELAEQVRGVPGCEDYKSSDVLAYFNRKRKVDAARLLEGAYHKPDPAVPPASVASAKILFPSLMKNPRSIQRLETLLQDDPDPSDDIAAIWAERIGYQAKAKDILTYVKWLRARKGHSHPTPPSTFSTMPILPLLPPFSAPRTQASHLPTPSTSPEPGSLPTSPIVVSPAISGRTSSSASMKEEEDELESDEDMELDSDSDSEVEVPLSATVAHTSSALPSRVQNDLVTDLQKVFGQPRPPPENDAAAPRSFAQFSRWIGGQEQAATTLLEEISKGRYAHLGLQPTASSAPPPRI